MPAKIRSRTPPPAALWAPSKAASAGAARLSSAAISESIVRSWPARWMMHTRHCALSQGALPRYFALGLKKLKSALDFIPSMDKKSSYGGLRMDELIRVLRAFDALPPEKRGEVLAA